MIFRFIQPLDMENILIGYLAGTLPIFVTLAFIFIAGLSAKFKMPTAVYLAMIGIFSFMMYSSGVGTGFFGGIVYLTIVLTSIVFYFSFQRLFQ